jgi:hypothetical protein
MTELTISFSDDQAADGAKLSLEAIHVNNVKKLPEKHIMVHLANSFLGHDDQQTEQRLPHIRTAF